MMSTDNESPRILRVAETTSTNSLLRELVIKESLPEGSVVVADFQTAVLLASPVAGTPVSGSPEPEGVSGGTGFFSKASMASSMAFAIASTSACSVMFLSHTTALTAASTPEKSLYSS